MLKLYLAIQGALISAKIFFAREEGSSIVEYSLLLGFLAAACLAAMSLLGTSLSNEFQGVSRLLNNAKPTP